MFRKGDIVYHPSYGEGKILSIVGEQAIVDFTTEKRIFLPIKYIKNGYDKDGYDKDGYDKNGKHKDSGFEASILNSLEGGDWNHAFTLSRRSSYLSDFYDKSIPKFLSEYISEYRDTVFSEKLPSDEQKKFLIDFSKYTLLEARAGSGKTTTLLYKTHLLVNRLGIQKNEIIFLAFNKSAVQDVNEKFQRFGLDRFENAMTFHSLGGRIGKYSDEEKLIEEDTDFQLTRAIPESMRRVLGDSENIGTLLTIFRETWEDDITNFLKTKGSSSEEYYNYVRYGDRSKSVTYQTLKGDHVKSKAEKWLADFLFEHNIEYGYEYHAEWGNTKNNIQSYTPDFCLTSFRTQKKSLLTEEKVWIEFWGIDEFDPKQQTPSYWSKSWQEYKDEMEWKRSYWKEKREHTLIEFSVRDINYFSEDSRIIFESAIKNRLESLGILCNKIPNDILVKKVYENHRGRLEGLVESFIVKSKQRRWSPNEVAQYILEMDMSPSHPIRTFYQFGLSCYREYENILHEYGKKDFSDILIDATDCVLRNKGDIEINISQKFKIMNNLKDIKYLLIDEYQDFSELYFQLISAIIQFNPNLKIICVGDDWQLINGFAGSQRKFYQKFGGEDVFPGGKRLSLRTTWRCPKEVVNLSNKLMQLVPGEGAISGKGHSGIIDGTFYEDIFLEYRLEHPNYRKDDIFFPKGKKSRQKNNEEYARYIKKCIEIIKSQRIKNKNTTFLIISRTGRHFFSKEELINAYIDYIKSDDEKWCIVLDDVKKRKEYYDELYGSIEVLTAHKSKGKEADVCILLQVGRKGGKMSKFPLIHPDWEFSAIFGDTYEDIFDEEKRLYYVALTRTKRDLYYISMEKIPERIGMDTFLLSTFK